MLAALRLKKINNEAAPAGLRRAAALPHVTSSAARFMLLSGAVVLAFIVYHLLPTASRRPPTRPTSTSTRSSTSPPRRGCATTTSSCWPSCRPRWCHDVYSMFVRGFTNPIIAGTYLAAQVLLAMHLSHVRRQHACTPLGLSSRARRAPAQHQHRSGHRRRRPSLGNISFLIAVQAGSSSTL